MKHGSLFSGIGGFDLAAQWMGWENVFQVEIDKFCQKVLEKNFPNTIKYGDITTTDFAIHRGNIDILTGGFPCQPFSVAGKRKGTEDDRFLWHEMLRAIKEISPRYVVAENVPGLLTQSRGLVFEQVCAEMEGAGYEVQPVIVPACAVNAPHKRERIWFIANTLNSSNRAIGNTVSKEDRISQVSRKAMDSGLPGGTDGNAANTITAQQRRNKRKSQNEKDDGNDSNRTEFRLEGRQQTNSSEGAQCNDELINGRGGEWNESWYEVAAKFCRVDDGIPDRIHRLKALGNAIVPQVAYQIFKAIEQTNNPPTTEITGKNE